MLRADRTRRGWSTRIVAAVGLFAATVGLGALPGPAHAQEAPKPVIGQTVVSEFRTGKVELIDAGGNVVGTIASGLNVPRGVLVLRDGSVIIAEYGGGRLVGTGSPLSFRKTAESFLGSAPATTSSLSGSILSDLMRTTVT